MLSKQKTKILFNDQYLRGAEKKLTDVDKSSTMSARVRITSIRINNKKFFRIDLPHNNPLNKPYVKLNLNTLPRPNYKDGSQEMYRMVNGLCQYCGHDKFNGTIKFSKKGYSLSDIYCTGCVSKQPWDYVYIYTEKELRNRGKDYAERKQAQVNKSKPNAKKITDKKKVIKKQNFI